MIKCIRNIKLDRTMDNLIKNALQNPEDFRKRLKVSERNFDIFVTLYNYGKTSNIANKYGISNCTCITIANKVCYKCERLFRITEPDSIDSLNLSNRVYNVLARAGLKTIKDLQEYLSSGKSLLRIRGCGLKCIDELKLALIKKEVDSSIIEMLDYDVEEPSKMVSVVIYDKINKLYKGLGSYWGTLSQANVYHSLSKAEGICKFNDNYMILNVSISLDNPELIEEV